MAFLTDTGTDHLISKLSDSKNIKINNKYGNRVYNVVNKLVEKADKITKAINQDINNTSHSFKVGVGDVDVSSDVEDGFTTLSMKGCTYQNIFRDFTTNNSSVVTITEDRVKWTKPELVGSKNAYIRFHNALTELNKVYTLVFFIHKNTLTRTDVTHDNPAVAKFNITSYNTGLHIIRKSDTGLVKVKLQQPATVGNDGGKPYLEVYNESIGELEISHPILLEGDYTNDPNIPLSIKGIVGVGEKSRNLFDGMLQRGYWYNGSLKPGDFAIANVNNIKIKPQTNYTFYIEDYKGIIYIAEMDSNLKEIKTHQIKSKQTIITSSNAVYIKFCTANTDLHKLSTRVKVQIEEGTIDTDYQPYGSYKIDILSHGKNMLSTSNLEVGTSVDVVGKNWDDCKKDSDTRIRMKKSIDVKNGQTYIINGPNSIQCVVKQFDAYNVGIADRGWVNMPYTFTTQDKTSRMVCMFKYPDSRNIKINDIVDANIQIEENSATNFEPYQEDKIQILLDEPLMKLPNGVCDEITKDGKLIRRVGKTVLDGSFNSYPSRTSHENKSRWVIWADDSIKNIVSDNVITMMCDRYKCITASNSWHGSVDGISQNSANNCFHLFIDKYSAPTTENKLAINEELRNNPVVVYYELSEPITVELATPLSLRIFKDGHIKFNNLIAPNSTHQVQLNKPAQIENTINETDILNSRLDIVEEIYDDLLLQTGFGIDLLRLDFNLGKEEK